MKEFPYTTELFEKIEQFENECIKDEFSVGSDSFFGEHIASNKTEGFMASIKPESSLPDASYLCYLRNRGKLLGECLKIAVEALYKNQIEKPVMEIEAMIRTCEDGLHD